MAICRGELRGHGHHMGGGEVREVGEESSHVCLELGEWEGEKWEKRVATSASNWGNGRERSGSHKASCTLATILPV